MVPPKYLTLIIALVLGAYGGCSLGPKEQESAPFKARYADFSLDVPKRADLDQAQKVGRGVSIRICDRHTYQAGQLPLCEGLTAPVVNASGLQTFITEPRHGTRFEFLRERPRGVRDPASEPMVTIPDARIDRSLDSGGEAYELSRIRVLNPDAPLTTTTQGWPLARCANHPRGSRYCTIGFLIRGAFVEAHVFAELGEPLDQKQIWDVASAVDAKLRALSAGSH